MRTSWQRRRNWGLAHLKSGSRCTSAKTANLMGFLFLCPRLKASNDKRDLALLMLGAVRLVKPAPRKWNQGRVIRVAGHPGYSIKANQASREGNAATDPLI